MKSSQQTTLRRSVALSGPGVHSGTDVRMTLHPADAHHGISFLRTGLPGGRDRLIEARHVAVSATELCTVLGDTRSGSVSTVEHLMSALRGLGVDNVLVEIDGPEMPIVDGSAAPFVAAIDKAGMVALPATRRHLKILKSVRVQNDHAFAELHPAESGFRLDVEIDFKSPLIGRQRRIFDLSPAAYRRDIARARTFGFMSDVERLWKAGFALGASLDNTVALGEKAVINPEGLRFSDEFVRHKVLDAIGDLGLAGSPILGLYRSYCGGHRLNVAILEELFSDRKNYALVDAQRAALRSGPPVGIVTPSATYASDAR